MGYLINEKQSVVPLDPPHKSKTCAPKPMKICSLKEKANIHSYNAIARNSWTSNFLSNEIEISVKPLHVNILFSVESLTRQQI